MKIKWNEIERKENAPQQLVVGIVVGWMTISWIMLNDWGKEKSSMKYYGAAEY